MKRKKQASGVAAEPVPKLRKMPMPPPVSDRDEDFAPQLANLHIALEKTRAPGKAYSAARAAGILR